VTVPEQIRKQSEAVDQFYATLSDQVPEDGELVEVQDVSADPPVSGDSAYAPESPSTAQSE
jgi:hypothetical protein